MRGTTFERIRGTGRALRFFAVALLAGCQSLGPGSIERDRLDYGEAIAAAWRQQTLLNIVKLRYFDAPVFLDVSSVISSYTLQSEVNLGAQVGDVSAQSNRSLGITGTYTDRPTVSYTPVTGEKYIAKVLRPIPPQAIFAMIQAGHPADYILSLTVRGINDVYNYSASPARSRREDPAFAELIEAIRRVQQAGALGMRVEKRDKEEVTLIFFREKVDPEIAKDIQLIKDTLQIAPGATEMLLTNDPVRRRKNEIALLTRSMWEVLAELSAGVEVPDQDVVEGRAVAIAAAAGRPRGFPIAHIHSGAERPPDAYAAAKYGGHWFWIDNRDLGSKRIFAFLTVFSAIAETGAVPQLPIITIPAS